jgi:hypothetical protein
VFLALRYTVLGAIFGFSGGLLYGLWYNNGFNQLQANALKGLLIGLFIGIVVGVWVAIFGRPQMVFDYDRHVTYKLARCAWCGAKGRNFLILPCRVCQGRGHVLAVEPRRKCAWCKGKGKEFGIFRCRVCDGTGWAYGHYDKKK